MVSMSAFLMNLSLVCDRTRRLQLFGTRVENVVYAFDERPTDK